LSFSGSF